jgi:hypothetical protein
VNYVAAANFAVPQPYRAHPSSKFEGDSSKSHKDPVFVVWHNLPSLAPLILRCAQPRLLSDSRKQQSHTKDVFVAMSGDIRICKSPVGRAFGTVVARSRVLQRGAMLSPASFSKDDNHQRQSRYNQLGSNAFVVKSFGKKRHSL